MDHGLDDLRRRHADVERRLRVETQLTFGVTQRDQHGEDLPAPDRPDQPAGEDQGH